MKRLMKWLFAALLVCGFLYSCVYHRMTYMSASELEWATSRTKGELMCFESQFGARDTVVIGEVNINNSINPINMTFFETGNTESSATAEVLYSFGKHKGMEGFFEVRKTENGRPVTFTSGLLGSWSHDVPLKLCDFKIQNVIIHDVIIFYNDKSAQPQDSTCSNRILTHVWSKKYGLLQYTFQDGTVFSRTNLYVFM